MNGVDQMTTATRHSALVRKVEFRAVAAALAVSLPTCGAGIAAGLMLKPVSVTYELRQVDSAGDEWVLDYALSRDDCRAALDSLPFAFGAFCAPIYSTEK